MATLTSEERDNLSNDPEENDNTDDILDDLEGSEDESETDSLFDESLESPLLDIPLASRNAPAIPGFYFDPALRLPQDLCDEMVSHCLGTYFTAPHVDQIMLFCRGGTPEHPPTGLPPVFLSLLGTLSTVLRPIIPPEVHALMFPASTTLARQAIINKYNVGDGITAHVDLLRRYGDGIIGVSFGSGCVMHFARAQEGTEQDMVQGSEIHHLYLPERSVLVMSGESRFKWMHGIEKRGMDRVVTEAGDGEEWLERTMRISVTFRWLLPGADVLT
ncbi:hypothetical protein CYLTODRAFT_421606 [Cylindrobasidium torrendii FP15055 ss-10]|uniref:Fe2OG dioxygenase domain-containing protein n=1 Tax=Cylindrobasidium torrendii FP15055 ss-10 TaxID=1314674 RepID=A0A0D7BD18_9AGAR|nr:hypothetical protein CYLTODRAFT_421606 [Cylindrobasidium torrendii FP15055 ss-10]